ncbi:hypothetical protein JIN84_12695 [Luteolibacter yonseiensis]|uniref:Uncharacterized protein n=1 Tax=Luteolibacter yonseiensis TaxID=1144680 RepID=A0A934R416_9BACT|nr:hypothetical protein [Luteolibacter yonseiensis]MBK1816477.1 hypothetical protein [Luteolibacter yonseiensis]
MPSPQTLLPWLLGGVIGAAGILQGLHWRSSAAPADLSGLENQLRIAGEENEMLRRENESLRSLAQGGGELSVPQEFIDRAEKESGLRFISSPVLHRLASEELRDRITAAIESEFGPAGIDDRQEAYKHIGWLRPDDDLLAQLSAVRAVGALGWFDEVTGEGWVTDRVDLKNIPDQAVLLRLLTRIVLNQHFPPPPAYPGDDAARAREAVHEGAAAGAEARFYAASAQTIGFMPMKENAELGLLVASLPPFMQTLTRFPLTIGKGLADSAHVQGNEKFQALFRNPPRTTRSILHPLESAREAPVFELPATPEDAFLTESGGLLGLRSWLELGTEPGAAAEIASAWQADRYVLFPDGEASTAVLWEIEMSDAGAADRLQEVALRIVAGLAGRKSPAKPGQKVTSSDKRHLLLTRPSPTRIRFLNTFEPTTADALGGR